MASSYSKSKGRRDNSSFVALPHQVMDNEKFIGLRPYSIKLLIDICSQYKGSNNGKLTATWSLMKKRKWRSKSTLSKSIRELKEAGLIIETRIGGLNCSSRYAITWRKLDYADKTCAHKLGDTPCSWKY